MNKLLVFLYDLLGRYTVRVRAAALRETFSVWLHAGVAVRSIRREENGDVTVSLSPYAYRMTRELSVSRNTEMPAVCRVRGLPRWGRAFRTHPGIAAGLFAGVFIVWLSTQYVWRIDILCPDNAQATRAAELVDTDAVRARLAEQGIAVGTRISDIHVRLAENRFLIGQTAVSFLAINREGTVLSVEARASGEITEDITGEPYTDEDGMRVACNLVADADGQIVSYTVRNGTAQVLPEQIVTKGTTLALGIMESGDGDIRFSRASGAVYARTIRFFQTELPLAYTEQVPTGEARTYHTLSAFGKTVFSDKCLSDLANVTFLKIFQNKNENSGNIQTECDTITKHGTVTTPGGKPLPLQTETVTQVFMKEISCLRTEEEAKRLCTAALEAEIGEALDDTEIFSRTFTFRTEDGILYAACTVDCIDDIAVTEDFRIRDADKK